jgi:uncharacterized protein
VRFISIILVGAIATYLIVAGGIYAAQRIILFHPSEQRLSPSVFSNLPDGVEEVTLKTSDGETLIAWYLPAPAGGRTILFFSGNAGHLPFTADRFRGAHKQGFGLLALAYRGYSGSTGEPTEEGLHKDADAAYAWLVGKVPADQIILHGAALGAAVATELAVRQPAHALVLEAPYTAAVDVFARRFWFLPVKYMIKDPFLTREIIGQVKLPMLFVEGENDEVVPMRTAQDLFARAPEPKKFIIIPGGSHNNLSELGIYEEIRAFINAVKK